MASVIRDSGGKKRVQFIGSDGERRTVRLGKVELRDAQAIRVRIERLVSAAVMRQPLDSETGQWVASLGDVLHGRLAAVGLVRPRVGGTLGNWLDTFFASRAGLKPESLRKLNQTRAKLESHISPGKPLHEITAQDASKWRDALAASGLSEAAVKTHVSNAKTIFAEAVRREVIARSPLDHLRGGVTPTRNKRYVTPEETERLLAAAPDAEWRLLIGLARLAGLRTPSETGLLTGPVAQDRAI